MRRGVVDPNGNEGDASLEKDEKAGAAKGVSGSDVHKNGLLLVSHCLKQTLTKLLVEILFKSNTGTANIKVSTKPSPFPLAYTYDTILSQPISAYSCRVGGLNIIWEFRRLRRSFHLD